MVLQLGDGVQNGPLNVEFAIVAKHDPPLEASPLPSIVFVVLIIPYVSTCQGFCAVSAQHNISVFYSATKVAFWRFFRHFFHHFGFPPLFSGPFFHKYLYLYDHFLIETFSANKKNNVASFGHLFPNSFFFPLLFFHHTSKANNKHCIIYAFIVSNISQALCLGE